MYRAYATRVWWCGRPSGEFEVQFSDIERSTTEYQKHNTVNRPIGICLLSSADFLTHNKLSPIHINKSTIFRIFRIQKAKKTSTLIQHHRNNDQ